MSAPSGSNPVDDELAPTQTEGFKVGEKKTLDEYTSLDANDESLNRWKASLGVTPDAKAAGPKFTPGTLSFISKSAPGGRMSLDLKDALADPEQFKTKPIILKEGIEYELAITFSVGELLTGLKFIQVVKRAGITFEKFEHMIGSFGPKAEPYEAKLRSEAVLPSGFFARAGNNQILTRIVDDDGTVHMDLEWAFRLTKDWQ